MKKILLSLSLALSSMLGAGVVMSPSASAMEQDRYFTCVWMTPDPKFNPPGTPGHWLCFETSSPGGPAIPQV
jgi:hypothetical protein